ncbi:hypothetical protein BTVI_152776 [Pitangus sulphuratus]|nr:hypothetical protein BTVI_152776 [Pitangus sulphuratus]
MENEVIGDSQHGFMKGRLCLTNLVVFNKAKCKVLHVGQGNPKHIFRLCVKLIESSTEKKDLGMSVDEELSMTWE